MTASTNLALRPFRNERLPWFLAALLLVAAILTTFVHSRFIGRLLSGNEANTVRVVREDEARIAMLEDEIAKEPPLKIEASELARLRAFKELVDRRVFPWRRLLTELEATLPPDVRLTRISPSSTKGFRGVTLELSGEARTKNAAFSLAEALDASNVFSNAILKSLAERAGETDFDLEVVFDPESPPASDRPSIPPLPPSTQPAANPVGTR